MSTMAPHPKPTPPDAVRSWLLAQARAWRVEHAADMTAVYVWRSRFLAGIGPAPVPALGSASWLRLPDTDPRKVAAAVAPAVAHLAENTPAAVAARLRRELAALDHAVVERIRTASWDLSGAQDWRHAATCPTHADLVRRRALAKCLYCTTEHAWTATRCPGCARGGTPTRAQAARSWTTPSTPDRRSVA